MGSCYKGYSGHFHSLFENVSVLKKKYGFNNGYFGIPGHGYIFNRNILSSDPNKTAKSFYESATRGGIEEDIYSKRTGAVIGKKSRLKDGSIITWRNVSSSDGSPAVDINIERSSDPGGVKKQKIHFVKENNK